MGLSEPLPLRHTARTFNVMDSPWNAWGDGYHDDTGALLSALGACKAYGGGTLWLPHGTYLLGTSLAYDGSYSLSLAGEIPSGWNCGGAQINFTGSGWALDSTDGALPSVNTQGNFLGVADLTLQLLGPNYAGGIFGSYVNLLLRGVVTVRGDPTQSPRIGTGISLTPSGKSVFSHAEQLYCEELDTGLLVEQDEFVCARLFCWNCQSHGLVLSPVSSPNFANNNHFLSVLIANALGGGTPAILFNAVVGGFIDNLHVEGVGVNYVLQYAAAAQANALILRIRHFEGDGLTNLAGLMTGQQAPAFEHMNYATWAGVGFGVATPTAPTQTGSSHAVMNTTGTRVLVYLDGNQVGTHIVDWLGNSKALPAATNLVSLENGDAVYFATTCPTAWLWERPN